MPTGGAGLNCRGRFPNCPDKLAPHPTCKAKLMSLNQTWSSHCSCDIRTSCSRGSHGSPLKVVLRPAAGSPGNTLERHRLGLLQACSVQNEPSRLTALRVSLMHTRAWKPLTHSIWKLAVFCQQVFEEFYFYDYQVWGFQTPNAYMILNSCSNIGILYCPFIFKAKNRNLPWDQIRKIIMGPFKNVYVCHHLLGGQCKNL